MSAGLSSPQQQTRPYRVTSRRLASWFNATLSSGENSVLLSPRSKRAASLKLPKVRTESKLEAEFVLQLKAHGVTGWTREFRPIPTRRFRLDFAFEREKVGIECDGGTWSNGRHSRGKGYDTDCEKLALCQIAGWTILKITGTHLKDGTAITWTKQALGITP